MKKRNNIILIGFMGVGKGTIAEPWIKSGCLQLILMILIEYGK